MIKIVVNPQREPKSYSFSQELIVIGEGAPETVDICFPAEGLHQNHLRISLKPDGYWIVNQANDPFVSLNHQPFGKKKLQLGDQIQIRDHILKIEELSFGQMLGAQSQNPEPEKVAVAPLTESSTSFPDVETLSQDENPEAWFPQDIEELTPPSKRVVAEEKKKPKEMSSLEHAVNPLIEEAYNLDEQKIERPSNPKPVFPRSSFQWKAKALKAFLAAILLGMIVISLIIVELYFRANGESEKEEMLAAEGIADYAMALTYATVYHIAPQKQNWIDPSFIKNNLVDLLSTTSIICNSIDSQGQFSSCPYILRFYTNQDFSRFLLLAQPSPSLSQWLLPKDAIIVDSKEMEIRKTKDLKTFNRLLSNQNPLDGSNGEEILAALKQAPIVSLNTLAKVIKKKEFSPPKALNYFKPGAQNKIYNAPRYHQFTSTFVKKVISLTHHALDNHELSILQSELEVLSKFPDLVLYSEGMQQAIQSYHSLKKLGFAFSFLPAYLLFAKDGTIINNHLVLESSLLDAEPHFHEKDLVFKEEVDLKPRTAEEELGILIHNKMHLGLNATSPILRNLNAYLSDALENDSLYLPQHFYELMSDYQTEKERIRNDLIAAIAEFREKHPKITEFMVHRSLREYGMLDLYHSKLYAAKKSENERPLSLSFLPSYNFLDKPKRESNLHERWQAFKTLLEIAESPIPKKRSPILR